MQYSANGPRRIGQVNEDLLSQFYGELSSVNFPISDLDACSVDPLYDPDRCLEALKEVYNKLSNFESRRNRDDSAEDEQSKYAKLFLEYGGLQTLLTLLMINSVLPDRARQAIDTPEQLRIKSLVLQILSRLVTTRQGEQVTTKLVDEDDVMDYVFSLLAYDETCLTACQLIEDMLQARNTVLNLNLITNLRHLVMLLDDKKLANFCRVLAVTISDLDIYENKSSLFAQHKQKSTKGFINIRDVNQELLLSSSDLVPRLVNIAVCKDYTPRYRGMNSELDCWMEWIENSMADDAFDIPEEDDLENFIGGISEPSNFGGPLIQQAGLKISNDLILRVQVIYVLGLFLVGKHRKKVQRKLADLQLIPGLSDLFDNFIWKCQAHRNNTRHRLRGHNASCECSPEVALKIQFLRLVHSFCDHSDYKHLLLTKSELSELKRINNNAGILRVEGLDKVNKALMCKGSKGLLTKIVEVMKKEPTASTFRFWLARAVESYLRGSTSFCDQMFLLKKGLLEHIATDIVDHEIRPKEILQSSFDLLGELVKFNIESVKVFDKVLCKQNRLEKFTASVHRNLVDSNMFIRALMLSLEHFSCPESDCRDYSVNQSLLLMHMAEFEWQVKYVRGLINLINVDNLTQENVSCLNTTLVFLMFANQKSQMPRYLRALTVDNRVTGECSNNQKLMRNFGDLLTFWQDHYLHKDKDCSALEKSSRIPFDYWKQTVTTLVSDDRSLDTSVSHYLEPDTGRDS